MNPSKIIKNFLENVHEVFLLMKTNDLKLKNLFVIGLD